MTGDDLREGSGEPAQGRGQRPRHPVSVALVLFILIVLAAIGALTVGVEIARRVGPGGVGRRTPWVETHQRGPTVVRLEPTGRFMMWYCADARRQRSPGFLEGLLADRLGLRLGPTLRRGICLAESQDGKTWSRHPDNPVIPREEAVWPTVLYDAKAPGERCFKIWYNVWPGSEIRYAWSPDGVMWRGHVTVLRKGAPGAFDDLNVAAPSVVRGRDGRYMMYYDAGSSAETQLTGGFNNHYIALAVSKDGEHWTKRGIVLRRGAGAEWDGYRIYNACVLYDPHGDLYEMWYAGRPARRGVSGGVGYAVSLDGVRWAKSPHNPILRPPAKGPAAGRPPGPPAVVEDKQGYHVWFTGQDRIEHAEQPPDAYAAEREAVRKSR